MKKFGHLAQGGNVWSSSPQSVVRHKNRSERSRKMTKICPKCPLVEAILHLDQAVWHLVEVHKLRRGSVQTTEHSTKQKRKRFGRMFRVESRLTALQRHDGLWLSRPDSANLVEVRPAANFGQKG